MHKEMMAEEVSNSQFQSERLRVARNANGLTLAELGDSIGTTRQYVSQLETGLSQPTEQNINSLSVALDVAPSFFYKPIKHPIDVGEAHFRHRLRTPDSKKKEVLSKLMLFEELVQTIDGIFHLPEVKFPEIQCSNNEEIERAAEKTRVALNLTLDKPVGNFTRIIENSGGVVVSFNGHDARLDALSVQRNRPIFVVLQSLIEQSPARVRFDLGHELGHIVMHRGIETGGKVLESEANRFSSAFLLPRSSFLNLFPGKITRFDWNQIYSIKIQWGVSVAAILRRMFDLNIIDNNLYRRGYIYLSKTGQRQSERYDDKVLKEEPELIRKCFEKLSKNTSKNISAQKTHLLRDTFVRNLFLGNYSIEAANEN